MLSATLTQRCLTSVQPAVRGAGGLSSKSLKQAKSLNTGLGAQTSKVTTLFAAQSAHAKATGAESKQEEAAMDDLLNELDEVVQKKPAAPAGRVTLATASFASPAAGAASKPKPAVMEDVYEYSRDYEDVDMYARTETLVVCAHADCCI